LLEEGSSISGVGFGGRRVGSGRLSGGLRVREIRIRRGCFIA